MLTRTPRTTRSPTKFVSFDEAASFIEDGDCVYIGGSGGGHAVPEAMIDAIQRRHATTGAPRGLMVVGTVAIGDWETTGFNKFAAPGLLRRIVAAGLNNCTAVGKLALADEIEAYTPPQGALAQLTREMAAGRPGLVTKVGLHTFVDPRHGGARQSPRSPNDLVKLVDIEGEEYLFYKSFPINVSVIRATTADERGNLTMEDEAFIGENFSLAAAARRQGGIVIAQVQRVAAGGSLDPRQVKVPGVLVDYVVVDPDQLQTYQTRFNPAYAGKMRVPDTAFQAIPFDIRKVIARRGAMELVPRALVNIGFGVSNGITSVAAEEGFYREVTLTAEQGIIGGMPAVGKDAGAGLNFDMLAPQPDQFDFYDGGGLDLAFLSFAEVDRFGNVNVSRFGSSIIGPGGFINISQGAKKVVFSGTLTTGGVDVKPDGQGGLALAREGKVKKFVPDVEQITFNGAFARERGQQVVFVTERAVFELTEQGITLTEIAAGIDLDRDVRQQIGFEIAVSPQLTTMDARIFRPQSMGLAADFRAKTDLAVA